MSQTYKTKGIILKGMPFGEYDRMVTVLTPEVGLLRSIVPGARKYKSKLGGKSDLFVVNEFLIVKGRSLDRIIQAETLHSYSGLSRDLFKLAAAQYLGELSISLALSEQPQEELYILLTEHLGRLEKLSPRQNPSPYLAHAAFHLLALGGIAPQVYNCCVTQQQLEADFTNPNWEVGFSFEGGGVFKLEAKKEHPPKVPSRIGAVELTILQQLRLKVLPENSQLFPKDIGSLSVDNAWEKIDRLLRDYAQYHLGQKLRSSQFIDNLLTEPVSS